MSYLALYRKFRPDSFDEVKGQEHVVTTLKNQIAHNRVGHAYLLCGTRGTGKTTVAKLIAKTMNCEHPTENGPCGECESCKAIADGSSLNVIEIDAASNNGVDNIRQINEAVQYAPAQGKYLVYIIDEAHQLSKGAYNALLKTLEEPPEYVIFILATTDDFSLPVTIKSRCQRFDFHRISIETIADRMQEILDKEGEKASRDALLYIARLADGSMRDALSILDECISANIGKELDRDSVLKTVGAVSVDVYIRMFQAIAQKDPEKALDIINETIWDGKDLTKFSDDLTWFMRNLLFLKISPDLSEELDLTKENVEEMLSIGADYDVEDIAGYLNNLQILCADIRKSSVKRVTLELAVIKMMYKTTPQVATETVKVPDVSLNAINTREIEALIDAKVDRELDRRISEAIRDVQVLTEENAKREVTYDPTQQSEAVVNNIKSTYPPATQEDIMNLANNWNKIIRQLNPLHFGYVNGTDVEPAKDYSPEGPAKLVIVLYTEEEDSLKNIYLSKPRNREILAEKLSEKLEKTVELDVRYINGRGGKMDKSSFALNRIKYDVKIMESEEERHG